MGLGGGGSGACGGVGALGGMGAGGGTTWVACVGVGIGGVAARGFCYFGGDGVLGFGAATTTGLGEGIVVCLGGWDASSYSSSDSATVVRAGRRLLGFIY